MELFADTHTFQVSEITALIKDLLEAQFSSISIEGELSNFRPASSGHWYFTLKDQGAVIQGVMFKYRSARVRFVPSDGMKVVVQGNIGVYAKRGNYQIICDSMEPAGQGNILAMLEERKRKLAEEGLFSLERKQPLPSFPKKIAVVTSPTGAAIRDILQVLRRRSSGVDVVILPAPVQGDEAGGKIAAQIRRANMLGLGDVLIVGRGGGSLEDLLPFSEEDVVRAVADSRIPVISAVGHEIDTSLSDLAADLQAPTPSAAAELVSKNREELSVRVETYRDQLISRIGNRIERISLLLRQFSTENLENRFRQVMQPYQLILDDCKEGILRSMKDQLVRTGHKVELLTQSLEGNSPKSIMARGYAVVSERENGRVLKNSAETWPGELIDIRLYQGHLAAEITDISIPREPTKEKENEKI